MAHKSQQEWIADEFTLPYQATQDTVWVSDPAVSDVEYRDIQKRFFYT